MRLFDFDRTAEQPRTTELEHQAVETEFTLESWLHANPDVILDEDLLIFGRQYGPDTGVPDLLALDQWGNVVVVELKKGQSGSGSASEETILSQPQNYMQSLSSCELEDLDEIYRQYKQYLREGKWEVGDSPVVEDTLKEAYKTTFGKTLDPDIANSHQRAVILAEEITRQTKTNVRYLNEQGLNFQCVEVREFSAPEDTTGEQTLLVSSMVVDYDVSRVQPAGRSSPTYPDLAGEILERAFPEFRSLVQADSLFELLPDGIDGRQQQLISDNPNHPESVVYRLDVKPDAESLLIGIDIPGGGNQEDVLGQIESNSEVFTENGFTVKGNPMYRVVVDEWDVKSADQVRNLIDEVAERYATLINLGHSTLADPE